MSSHPASKWVMHCFLVDCCWFFWIWKRKVIHEHNDVYQQEGVSSFKRSDNIETDYFNPHYFIWRYLGVGDVPHYGFDYTKPSVNFHYFGLKYLSEGLGFLCLEVKLFSALKSLQLARLFATYFLKCFRRQVNIHMPGDLFACAPYV